MNGIDKQETRIINIINNKNNLLLHHFTFLKGFIITYASKSCII